MEQMNVQCYSKVCFHHSRHIILSSASQQKKCKVLGRPPTFANVPQICAVVLHYFQLPTITNYQCNITSLRSSFAIFPTCAKLLDFRVSWAQAVVHPSEHVMPGWFVIMMIMVKIMKWLPNDDYLRKHVLPRWNLIMKVTKHKSDSLNQVNTSHLDNH